MSRTPARPRSLASAFTVLISLPLALFLALTLAPASASGAAAFASVGLHDQGPRVTFAQRVLDVPCTGRYNLRTRHAVKSFQHRRGLSDTGVINERTWQALQSRWDRVHQRRVEHRRAMNSAYHRVLTVARNQFGDPYQYGAAGPNAFDCSGYTMWVYRKATGKSLPHLATGQYRLGQHISRAHARPGDLVFYHHGGDIYHAAIYAGHGDVYHSPHSGSVVQRDPMWGANVYFARVINRNR